jgi:hypothetical protein
MALHFWLWIEAINVAGLIWTNVSFMFLRSCFRSQLNFEKSKDPNHLPGSETILAQKPAISSFNSMWVPFLVIVILRTHFHDLGLKVLGFVTFWDALSVTIVIFTPTNKGNQWFKANSKKLFAALLLIAYVITPSLVLILLIYTFATTKLESSYIFSELLYYFMMYFFRFGEAYTKIWPYIREQRELDVVSRDLELLDETELKLKLL